MTQNQTSTIGYYICSGHWLMIYYGCDIPSDLYYDIEREVWIRFEGEIAILGMTDMAQTRCGKISAITFRPPGRRVVQGKPLATIESAKWVGPFPAPFSCEILETNEATFSRDVLMANKDPYGEGWLVKVKPLNPEEYSHLVTGLEAEQRYQEKINRLNIRCFRCVEV